MTAMPRPPRSGTTRRYIALVVGPLLIAAACSKGDDARPSPSVPVFTTAPLDTNPATTEDTTGVTSPPSTQPPDTTSTTSTTMVPVTTTTEPLAIQELVLRGDGIGSARFGADPDGVIGYVASILGGNTDDTGWVDPFAPVLGAVCDGTVARRVDWGVLKLRFGDLSDVASGRRHFLGWEYGLDGQIGDEPAGLRTAGGTTLGSRVVDLLAEFPEASVNEGEADLNIPPNFYVSDNFRGLLTGTSPDDVVTVIFGGYGCFE